MTNDQRKFLSHEAYKDQNGLAKRLVFKEESEQAKGETEKAPDKKESLIHNVDFDKNHLDKKEATGFDGNLENSIREILKKVEGIDENDRSILSTDLNKGLEESVSKNLSIDMAKFGTQLMEKGCDKVRLHYNNATDTLEFQFLKKNGEKITFNQKDITVQYVPRNLNEKVEYKKSPEAIGEMVVNSNKELKEKIPNPQEGDMIIVTRAGRYPEDDADKSKAGKWYETKIKAIYDTEKKAFVVPGTKQELYFFRGNKVTYIPHTLEKAQPKMEFNIDGQSYRLLTEYKIEDGISYSQLAGKILNENGGGIVDAELAQMIKDTLVSQAEYAALLKAAHEQNGKTESLPIILPLKTKVDRQEAQQKIKEEEEANKNIPEVVKKAGEDIQKRLGASLVEVRTRLDKEDRADFDQAVKEFQAELPKAIAADLPAKKLYEEAKAKKSKGPIDRESHAEQLEELKTESTANVDSLISDLVEDLDDNFPDNGKERKVNSDIVDLLDNKHAWNLAWKEGKIEGQKQLEAITNNFPSLKSKTPKLRDIVFNILEAGDNTSFNSMDVMKGLQLNFPAGDLEKYNIDTYSELQGLAAMIPDQLDPPGFKDPSLDKAYQAAISIVQPVEAFSNVLAEMKVSGQALAKKVEQGKKAVEVNEKDPKAKQHLAKLIQQIPGLNLDSEITNFDTEGDMYAAHVNLQGRKAILEVINGGWPKDWTVNVKDIRGTLIASSSEAGSFDVEDHIEKVRNAILGMAVNSKADTSKLPEVISGEKKYVSYSINKLEQLSGDLPGLSWADYPSNIREKSIYQRTNKLLTALGVQDSARIVDQPDNLQEFRDNDEVLLNLNYKGQPLTMKITNGVNYFDISLARGYNQNQFKDEATITHINGADLIDPVRERRADTLIPELISEIDGINGKLPEYARLNEAIANEPSIAVDSKALAQFNEKVINNKAQELSAAQFLETIFQVYTFAELIDLGIVSKIKDKENAYVISQLPESFLNNPDNKDRLSTLAFVVKNGGKMDLKHLKYTQEAREKAREGLNSNKLYLSRIADIFSKDSALVDRDGRKVDWEEVENTGAKSEYLDDKYFQETAGSAAHDRFLDAPGVRPDRSSDKINLEAANAKLNSLYQEGLKSLARLAGTSDKKYQEMYAQLEKTPHLKTHKPDLSKDITPWEKEIIRLGYLEDRDNVELEQDKRLAKFREELAEKQGPVIAQNAREKGIDVTDEEVKASLKELPISFLLGCQVNTLNDTVTVGVATPIALPINENFTFVITPGLGGIIGHGANRPDGAFLGLTIGILAKTTLDGKVGERFTLIGGVHAGLGAGVLGDRPAVGPVAGVHGGVEIELTDPRDKETTTRHYLGVHGGLGLALDTVGVGAGVYYKWKDDVDAILKRDLKELYQERELTPWIEQYEALTEAKPAREAFANKLKADERMSQYLKLDVTPVPDTEKTIMLFKRYVSEITNKFVREDFDPGVILGGTIGVGAHHIIMPPLWFIDVLGGLKINIGKDVFSSRERTVSEDEMDKLGELQQEDARNKHFNELQGSEAERQRQTETAGKRFTDSKGEIRISESDSLNGLEKQTVGPNLDKYNEVLSKAGLKLEKDAQGRIEIQYIADMTDGNTRLLIGPNVAVREGGKTYLKSPNSLNSLYAHRFDKLYPFPVSHGATKLSVIILSDNRFYSHKNLPTEIELTKFKGESVFTETLNKANGTAEAYNDQQIDLSQYKNAAQDMDKVLSNGEKIGDKVRDDLDKHAKKLYTFVDSKKQNFLSITNMDAQNSKKAPAEFNKETLYTFFDEYAEKNKEKPFTPVEKEDLFLRLTEMRYVEIARGYGEEAAYQERLNWAKNKVLIPYFKERIKDIGNPPITMSAEQLAQKAIDDIKHLSVSLPASELDPFTSAATALGRGSDGMHMILKIGQAKEYGYVTGKDYTEALKKKDGSPDYQLALVLKSQIEALPEDLTNKENLDRFMRSSLAMKTASLDALTLVLGLEEFEKVKKYYAGEAVNAEELKTFIDLIKNLETTRNDGKISYLYTNAKKEKYIFQVTQSLKSGVFQKCANYTITYNDEVAIIRPPEKQVMKILASQGEALTGVETSVIAEFNSLFGGVIASVNVSGPDTPPGGGGGNEPEPEAPAEGEVDQEAGKPEAPDTTDATPQQPDKTKVPDTNGGV